ncbi:sulfate/molybdate ABC transporter ATP-binding protein [Gordonia soli]|uniref:Molybdate ABC transporter ATP-binding protein n=1 Tax=Gordonia soli NBRC 108243 TaxID=1223545 RepID=M0QHR3_9ACTN|nr:ABC transporter ATP-binding protein [Gordonia soli]GAC66947.1 molybdate ABC transporter ATP-binding protein [Gordonia soli NBRC 108243]
MTAADTAPGGLSVEVENTVPRLHLAHTFASGSTTAIIGPNGAGKTTLLKVVAGLLAARTARISVDGEILSDGHTLVPTHRRGVALLSQDARLFPHLSVAANVAFAPSSQHLPRAEVRRRVDRWLTATEVADLADRRPHQLSGGQAQRVAIARALAAEPRILLLDEPFRALDVDVAGRLRTLLRELLSDRSRITAIVTHDVVDIVSLADEAMVLDSGQVVDSGSVERVLSRPSNVFTAGLAGLNIVAGTWDGTVLTASDATGFVGDASPDLSAGDDATAVFSPEAVAVFTTPPTDSSFRNIHAATITQVIPHGGRLLLRATVGQHIVGAEITRGSFTDLGLSVGDHVHLAVKASAVRVH